MTPQAPLFVRPLVQAGQGNCLRQSGDVFVKGSDLINSLRKGETKR